MNDMKGFLCHGSNGILQYLGCQLQPCKNILVDLYKEVLGSAGRLTSSHVMETRVFDQNNSMSSFILIYLPGWLAGWNR